MISKISALHTAAQALARIADAGDAPSPDALREAEQLLVKAAYDFKAAADNHDAGEHDPESLRIILAAEPIHRHGISAAAGLYDVPSRATPEPTPVGHRRRIYECKCCTGHHDADNPPADCRDGSLSYIAADLIDNSPAVPSVIDEHGQRWVTEQDAHAGERSTNRGKAAPPFVRARYGAHARGRNPQ